MTSKLTITDERLAELVAFKPLPGTDINSATRDEWMAMAAELQERRKAAEPVAIVEPSDYVTATQLVGEGPARKAVHELYEGALRIGDKLYRHAQQSVVPDRSIFEIWWESQNGAPLDGWDSLRTTDGYCDDGIDGQFEAWNAAMLQAGSSPVIPEWIPVSELMPEERETVVLVADERGIVWCAEIQDGEIYPDEFPGTRGFGCAEATHWMPLPAAPQEVKGE
ncbi:hypothetical protein AI2932V1_3122 [Klebsiella pneumoniae]|nr:hypothetical protein AI2932V1_3122 [Klebsiella pneumoniae]